MECTTEAAGVSVTLGFGDKIGVIYRGKRAFDAIQLWALKTAHYLRANRVQRGADKPLQVSLLPEVNRRVSGAIPALFC